MVFTSLDVRWQHDRKNPNQLLVHLLAAMVATTQINNENEISEQADKLQTAETSTLTNALQDLKNEAEKLSALEHTSGSLQAVTVLALDITEAIKAADVFRTVQQQAQRSSTMSASSVMAATSSSWYLSAAVGGISGGVDLAHGIRALIYDHALIASLDAVLRRLDHFKVKYTNKLISELVHMLPWSL